MGYSTDANLTFGIDLGEVYPYSMLDYRNNNIDFEDYVAEFLGLTGHWRDTGYKERRDALLNQCPIEIITYSGSIPCYIIALKNRTTTAYRGSPVTINPDSMVVTQEEITAFKEWCLKLEINRAEDPDEPPLDLSEPSWLLFSYEG